MLTYKLLLLGLIINMFYETSGSSIGFVIDNTFSMKRNIAKVKDTCSQIANIHSQSHSIDKYVLVKFNEHERFTESKIYDNRYLFDVGLNLIDGSDTNLDCPEPVLNGITEALKLLEPKSKVYVFTDASAKDYYRSVHINYLCNEYDIQISFIVTGHCLKDPNEFWTYDSVARNCSGNVFLITKDDLNQIPKYIRDIIKGNPKVLKTTEAPPNLPTDVAFQIDQKLEYVIISVSGRNVLISSREVYAEVIRTDNFKAIKILKPFVGEHSVLVSGDNIKIVVNVIAAGDESDLWKSTTLNIIDDSTKYDKVTLKSTIDISESKSEPTVLKPPTVEISEGYNVEVPLGGDVLLTCKVTAIPEPDITWENSHGHVQPSTALTIDNQSIHISFLKLNNITESDFYNCKALNSVGNDTKYIRINIKDSQVVFYQNIEGIYSESDNVLIDKSISQQTETEKDVTTIPNITGYPPALFFERIEDEENIIDWCETTNLYCGVDAKPEANFEWFFYGNLVNGTEEFLDIDNTGNYTCVATNTFGSLEIEFTVVAKSCCIVNIAKSVNNRTPFITNENEFFSELRQFGRNLIIPANKSMTLICHNRCQQKNIFYRNHVTVRCDHEYYFNFEDRVYTFDDMDCVEDVIPIVRSFDVTNKEKLVEVGFMLNGEFFKIYNILNLGAVNGGSIIARYSKTPKINDNIEEIQWFNHPEIVKIDIEGVYNCINDTSICCYGKRHLVNPHDVPYGGAQTSTFIDNLNSVPFWRTCNSSIKMTLDDFEKNLIEKINQTNSTTLVWSGASDYFKFASGYAPRYLWKVIKNVQTTITYVYINEEDADLHHIDCNNLSNLIPDEFRSRLYMCSLDQLITILNVPSHIFEN